MKRSGALRSPSEAVHLCKQLLRECYWQGQKRLAGHGLARFRLVRSLVGLIRATIRSGVAEVLGHRMYLDAKDSAELSINGIYEPLTTELVQREVRAGDVVLDIGAHIGYYTLLLARQVGHEGKVFAFEPEPGNFCLLQKNVRVNGYENVTLIPKAVAAAAGMARLYLDEDNAGDCRIYDSRDGRRSLAIETIRLDDYFAGYEGTLAFIKMDIQGAEHAALSGMTGLLGRHREVKLVTEFWPYGLKACGVAPEDYLRLLVDLGFTLWNVDERPVQVMPTSIAELLERYPPAFGSATNLFCVRR